MFTQVIMPLQNNLANKSSELTNSIVSTFWPKTPQPNKYRQIMEDKNSNKKRRHHSEQSKHHHSSLVKTPMTPTNTFVNKTTQLQSSPFYAGAKFSKAPLPSFLPKPPTEWITPWIQVNANLENLNNLTNLNELNADLNKLINTATSAKIIENTIEILENTSNRGKKAEVTSIELAKKSPQVNQTTISSKYYEKKQTRQRSTSAEFVASTFQYNFRNTRRNTPQCQTKCKINRYSSFSRQNIHQKIAAVN